MNDMPKKETYFILVVLGFVLGVIWGALSLGPYNKFKAAIENGDSEEAWDNAKKIRTYIIIAGVVNVLMIIGQLAQLSAGV